MSFDLFLRVFFVALLLISALAGRHVVRVRHPAYKPLEREVRVEPSRSTKLVIDLPSEAIRK